MAMRFAFDNRAHFVSSSAIDGEEYNWYDWTVFMNEPAEKLALVKSVEYRLHETFPNPVRTITDRDSRFALDSSGWGEFTIRIAVHLLDGSVVRTKHELALSKATQHGEELRPQA
jgi:transcription initiation factor IIF auxiliary subunit